MTDMSGQVTSTSPTTPVQPKPFDCSWLVPRKFKAWLEKKKDEPVGVAYDETRCPITNYVLDCMGLTKNIDLSPIYVGSIYTRPLVRTGLTHTSVSGQYCHRTQQATLTRFVALLDRTFGKGTDDPAKRTVTGQQALEILNRVSR